MNSDERTVKISAICGALAPVAYTLGWVIAGAMIPGYNPMSQYVSEAGTGGGTASYIMNFGGFFLCGLFLAIFAVGLSKKMREGQTTRMLIPVAVGLSGAGFVATAFFPMYDPLHRPLGFFASFIQLAPLFAIYTFRKDADWRKLWVFSIAIVAASVFIGVVIGALIPTLPGLHQRLLFAPVWIWTVVVSVNLYRMAELVNENDI